MLEQLSQYDDDLMCNYIEDIEIKPEQIRAVLRKATISNSVVPVVCGTALRNKGVQPVLDCVVDYLPSPMDLPDIMGVLPGRTRPSWKAARRATRCAAFIARVQDHGGLQHWRPR